MEYDWLINPPSLKALRTSSDLLGSDKIICAGVVQQPLIVKATQEDATALVELLNLAAFRIHGAIQLKLRPAQGAW